MKARFMVGALALSLGAHAAHAQYYPTANPQPYCREFTKVVDIGGRRESAYGTACMQPDGSWQIVSDDIPTSQPLQYMPEQHQVMYVPQPVAVSAFSISFDSWNNPSRMRHYNDYGHGWRERPQRGRGHEHGRGRGHH